MLRPVAVKPNVSHQLSIAQDTIAKNESTINELQHLLVQEREAQKQVNRAKQELATHNEQLMKQLHAEQANGNKLVKLIERKEEKLASLVAALATCQAQLDGRERQLTRGESKYDQIVREMAKQIGRAHV